MSVSVSEIEEEKLCLCCQRCVQLEKMEEKGFSSGNGSVTSQIRLSLVSTSNDQ